MAAVTMLLSSSCKSNELKDQIMVLTQQRVLMANERDSLFRLLEARQVEFDTLTASYNALSESNRELLQRFRNLQAGYSARGAQIKKAESEKVELNGIIAAQTRKNDSLVSEISDREDRIAALNQVIESKEAENSDLAEVIRQKDIRIETDSLKEVARLKQPKENGFVNIFGLSGGFGLGETDPDYSSRVIGFDNIFGYQINRHFLAGAGLGLRIYDGGLGVPLFLGFRYSPIPGSTGLNPFIAADGGLEFFPESMKNTNIFIQPALGLQKALGPKTSLKVSVGSLTVGKMPTANNIRSTFLTIKGAVSFSGKNGPLFRQ